MNRSETKLVELSIALASGQHKKDFFSPTKEFHFL